MEAEQSAKLAETARPIEFPKSTKRPISVRSAETVVFLLEDRPIVQLAMQSENSVPAGTVKAEVTDWQQRLTKGNLSDQDLQRLVLELNQSRNHKELVKLLEAALILGRSQPWMYEVLAISMEVIGRPKAEVERILLSIPDFSAGDVDNLLVSAAYLARLDADQAALKLYKEVATHAPTRPESYRMGLELATELKQPADVLWSAAGLVETDWTSGYEKRHRSALRAVQAIVDTEDSSSPLHQSAVQALQNMKQLDLQIRIQWNGTADLDMTVHEPLGTICAFDHQRTAGGGILVHDGSGPNAKQSYEYYVCPMAASGDYKCQVSLAGGKLVGNRATMTVIRYAGTDHEQTNEIPIVFDKAMKVFRVTLHQGRRVDLSQVPQKTSSVRNRRQTARQRYQLGQQSRQNLGQLQQLPQPTAIGFAPVVQPVASGSQAQVQAVVSPDRRYVTIGINTSVSDVVDVPTFTIQSGQ